MNWKRFFVASLAVFVFVQAMEFLINTVFMKTATEALKALMRPDFASKAWVMYVLSALVALLFTYIFVKGREGKGIAEGVRYGIIIWLFVTVPMSHAMWAMMPIPYATIFRWMLFGLLEMLISGILVAAIYKPRPAAKA